MSLNGLKICHLTSVHPRNDIRIFHRECSSLAKYGAKVALIVADSKPNEKINGVNIISVGVLRKSRLIRMIYTVWRVYQRALLIKYDIYHLHDPELLPIGFLLKLRGKIVIYDAHEDVPKQVLEKVYIWSFLRAFVSFLVRLVENFFAKRINLIVTATPGIRKKFEDLKYNVVDINNFPLLHEFEEIPEWDCREPRACYLGAISEARGIKEVVKAIGESDIYLDVAGSFSSDKLKKDVEKIEEWKKVDYHGLVDRDRIRFLLDRAKVGLVTFYPSPNHVDARPNKLFEYMLAGIPVVASNFPRWRELVEENNCGICVDPYKIDEISNAIIYLLSNDKEAKIKGDNGRQLVLKKYNWSNEELKLIEEYKKIAAVLSENVGSLEKRKDEKKAIAGLSFINMMGNGFRIALSFFTVILVSRVLGAEGYGKVNIILSYTAFLHYMFTAGFDNGLTFFVTKYMQGKDKILSLSALKFGVFVSLAIAMFVLILITCYGKYIFEKNNLVELTIPFIILACQMEFEALSFIISGFLRGVKVFIPTIVREQIVFPVVNFSALVILLVLFEMDILGFALGYSLATFLSLVFISSYLFFTIKKLFPEAKKQFKSAVGYRMKWLRFSLPVGLMTTLEPMVIWSSVIVLGFISSPTDVGIFSVCFRVGVFVSFFLKAIAPIFSPFMAEIYAKNDMSGFSKLHKTINFWSMKWAILLIFLFFIIPESILSIFGKEYETGTVVLLWMLPGLFFDGAFGSSRWSLIMAGKNKIDLINFLLAILINIIATWILVPHLGLVGAGISFSLAFIVLNLLRIFEFYLFFRIAPLSLIQLFHMVSYAGCAVLTIFFLKMFIADQALLIVSSLTLFVEGLILLYWKDRNIFLDRMLRRRN